MSLRVCLIGYGQMGKSIDSILSNFDCETHHIIQRSEDWSNDKIKECDVAIEFSLPTTAKSNIIKSIEANLPIVSGTTGWLEDIDDVKTAISNNPKAAFLYGSNFSLGMNLFFRINQFTSSLMAVEDSYKLEMTEIHHTKKLDKPSGTAITLAEDIINTRSDKKTWINESTESSDTIGIISERIPDVPGTHIIQYENNIDSVRIEHIAKSRLGFAQGAILAAKWLVDKKGYFTISDYIDDLLLSYMYL